MATITETKTTITEENYETPVYIKNTGAWFAKIYSASKMVFVDVVSGGEEVSIQPFPNGLIPNISDQETSNETEFETARDATIAILEAL